MIIIQKIVEPILETHIVYMCPICGRTINHPKYSVYFPNLVCHHNDGEYIMAEIEFK